MPDVLNKRSNNYKPFLKLILKLEKNNIHEYVLDKDSIHKDGIQYLHDFGDKGQIFEWEDHDFIWRIDKIESVNNRISKIHISKVKDLIPVKEVFTSLELDRLVEAKSSGILQKGSICLSSKGHAVLVKDFGTIKTINKDKSYNDFLNNPLRKEIFNIEESVIYHSEQRIDGHLMPNSNFNLKETGEMALSSFLAEYAVTDYRTMQELNSGVKKMDENSVVIPEIEEDSHALVSVSNKSFLENLSKDIDKKRNAAAVVNNGLARSVELFNRELDIKRRELEAQLEMHRANLMSVMNSAKQAIVVFQKQLKKIHRLIATLEIYLGIHEDVIQIQEGTPAPETEPIHLFQQFKYMDEEYGDPTEGGLDFSMIEQWDKWVSEKSNYEKIIPTPKGVCLMKVRRFKKDRGDTHPLMRAKFEKMDEFAYIMIRNGENIYRIWSTHISEEIETGRMFPKRTELMDYLGQMSDSAKKQYEFRDDEQKQEEYINEKVDDYIFSYKKLILMIQGVIFRTDIFAPVPPGLDLFKPETHDGRIVFVYDDEYSLPSDRLPFKVWLNEINRTITKGSRVIVSFGSMSGHRFKDYYDRFVINFRESNLPPKPEEGLYTVEVYEKEEIVTVKEDISKSEYYDRLKKYLASHDADFKKLAIDQEYIGFNNNQPEYETIIAGRREYYDIPDEVILQYKNYNSIPDDIKKLYIRYRIPKIVNHGNRWLFEKESIKLKKLCIRYNPGDKVYAGWGQRFSDGSYQRDRKVPLTFLINKDDNFILNYDCISLEDVDFYLNDRISRKDYLIMMPLLWKIRKQITEDKKWEDRFVELTNLIIQKELGITQDVSDYIRKSINWYKYEVVKVWKRSITEDDIKALRMIKQETKRLLRDEAGFKNLDTGVDNTKKCLIFKCGTKAVGVTGVTKQKFLHMIVGSGLFSGTGKAFINRNITDTEREDYVNLLRRNAGNLTILQSKE